MRPYLKAPERKVTVWGPVNRKSITATDTPERDEFAEKKMTRNKPKCDKMSVDTNMHLPF